MGPEATKGSWGGVGLVELRQLWSHVEHGHHVVALDNEPRRCRNKFESRVAQVQPENGNLFIVYSSLRS